MDLGFPVPLREGIRTSTATANYRFHFFYASSEAQKKEYSRFARFYVDESISTCPQVDFKFATGLNRGWPAPFVVR